MIYIHILFLYTFINSIIINFGIGLNLLIHESPIQTDSYKQTPFFILNIFFVLIVTFFLKHFIFYNSLVSFVIPLIIIFVNKLVSFISSFIFKKYSIHSMPEKLFVLGSVFISLYDSISFFEALFIALSCVLSYFLWTSLLLAVFEKIKYNKFPKDWYGLPIIFVNLGLLSLACYIPEISWWLQNLLI